MRFEDIWAHLNIFDGALHSNIIIRQTADKPDMHPKHGGDGDGGDDFHHNWYLNVETFDWPGGQAASYRSIGRSKLLNCNSPA